jgi:hypothetical protein
VVETKNFSGWIYGNEWDSMWTQTLFGKKRQFRNPLRQNYGHVRALADFLKRDRSIFHSVVFFVGRCEFKTPMPTNVMNAGLGRYIRDFQNCCIDETGVVEVVSALQRLKADPALTPRVHAEYLKEHALH